MKIIFTDKERYLLGKQKCFVLDHNLDSPNEDIDSEFDSDRKEGPKQSQKWWDSIQNRNESRLMNGLTSEIKSKKKND